MKYKLFLGEANVILEVRIIRNVDSILLSQEQYYECWDTLSRLLRYLRDSMNYVIEYNGFPIVLEG